MPDRALGSDESARWWGQDRGELGDCGAKNRVLVTGIEALEQQLDPEHHPDQAEGASR